MTMFLIQSLLWLLAAFLLGYGIGRWLKGVFCKRRTVATQTKLQTETAHLRVPVTTAAVAAGTAATAALAHSREPVKPTVNVKEPELKTPKVTATAPELKATVTPLKADIELPKANLKAPTVSVAVPTLEVKAPNVDLPKIDVKVPTVEPPKVDVELSKVDVNLAKLDVKTPQADVDLPKLDSTLPKVEVKAPTLDLPTVDTHRPSADLSLPKVDVDLPASDLPKVEASVPKLDIALPQVDVNLPKVEVSLPEVEAPKIELKDMAAGMVGLGVAALGVVATNIKAPEGELDLNVAESIKPPEADVGLQTLHLEMPESQAELSAVEWPDAKVSGNAVTVKVPDVHMDLPEAKLPDMDVGLAAANLHTPEGNVELTALSTAVPETVIHLPEAGLNLEHAKVDVGLVELNTPDGLYTVEGAKVEALDHSEGAAVLHLTKPDGDVHLASLATEPSGHVHLAAVDQNIDGVELQSFDLGTSQTGLVNPAWLASLKEAALAQGNTVLANAADQALAQTAQLSTTEIGSVGVGLSSDLLATLKQAAAGAGVGAVVAKAADVLANTPKPVDESDVIEAGKHVAEAVLNPAGLSVTELGSLGQGLNADSLTGLTVAAAGAATVAAVQANLQSGVQPMIVDESDAIEAIKLAWDGELSPAELAALEHTLLLRPGETGRLGLVTCSVPGTNCVSLGGLEGELNTGDAMRSNLFNMAVTHNDDGNYIFSSLSKWLPDWIKSGGFSEHTDELTSLVWDNEPSAVDYAAGYQLTLREGQYGDLGLVSCAVNEAGSVSLGGLVGSIAEGQTAVSKLYGIFIERADDIYTFKQFAKPVATSSWLTSAQGAAAALGAGVAASVNSAVETVKETVLPVTKSTTTDMLEPDLDWSEDKLRINMQRLIEESHGSRGSKLVSQLWDSDSGYDCGVIEGEESLVLKPGLYGKLGSVHCGVTKPGRVVVSGDVSSLAEGEGVLFHLYSIVVCRDDEDNYRFERLKDLV